MFVVPSLISVSRFLRRHFSCEAAAKALQNGLSKGPKKKKGTGGNKGKAKTAGTDAKSA